MSAVDAAVVAAADVPNADPLSREWAVAFLHERVRSVRPGWIFGAYSDPATWTHEEWYPATDAMGRQRACAENYRRVVTHFPDVRKWRIVLITDSWDWRAFVTSAECKSLSSSGYRAVSAAPFECWGRVLWLLHTRVLVQSGRAQVARKRTRQDVENARLESTHCMHWVLCAAPLWVVARVAVLLR
jgi:hypothetical protein